VGQAVLLQGDLGVERLQQGEVVALGAEPVGQGHVAVEHDGGPDQ